VVQQGRTVCRTRRRHRQAGLATTAARLERPSEQRREAGAAEILFDRRRPLLSQAKYMDDRMELLSVLLVRLQSGRRAVGLLCG
jgi:hypothetical protein